MSRAYVVALGCGVGLAFAWPEPNIAPLAWVLIAPFLALAARARFRRGAGLGFVFGLGFFGALLHWISIIGYLGWAILVVLQAMFLALFGILWAATSRLDSWWARIGTAAAAWVAIEFVRALVPVGGFTWGELAQSQTELSWLLPAASLGGGWLVAGIVVALNAALVEVLSALRRKDAGRARPDRRANAGRARPDRRANAVDAGWGGAVIGPGLVMVALLAAPLAVPVNEATGTPLTVAIVQGNVPREFTGSTFDKELLIVNSHRHITEELADVEPDLVIWPESSVGLDLTTNAESAAAVSAAARAAGAPMIVGGNLDVGDDRYKVMAFHVDSSGEVVDRYQKTHLVPFGEYVPARDALGWIPALDQVPRDAVAADEPVTFDIAGGEVAPVISFEGDFGSLVRKPMAEGGRLLVVATNTSTWEYSWASAQHVAFSRVRAVENGVWVAHAALSGISAFITPQGDVIESTPLWVATALVQEVRFAERVTLYARVGDWFPLLCIGALVVALVVIGTRRHPRRGSRSDPGMESVASKARVPLSDRYK